MKMKINMKYILDFKSILNINLKYYFGIIKIDVNINNIYDDRHIGMECIEIEIVDAIEGGGHDVKEIVREL